MKNAGLKLTCLIYIILIFSGNTLAEEEFSNSEECGNDNIFVGVSFSKSEYIDFHTEPDERQDWNMIILDAISKVTRKPYFLTYSSYLGKYTGCQNSVVKCQLDSYTEKYVGGGERTGTVTLTFQFLKNVEASMTETEITITATGESDYGHSHPLEYAIKEACYELEKKELGYKRLRIEFGPSLGLHQVDGRDGLSFNFDAGFLYGGQNAGMAFILGSSASPRTIVTSEKKVDERYLVLGAGVYYGYCVFQNSFVAIIPKIKVGFWDLKNTSEYYTHSGPYVNTTGNNVYIYDYDKTKIDRNTYYLFPNLDIRLGKLTKWFRAVFGAYIGEGEPIWTLQLGFMVTGK